MHHLLYPRRTGAAGHPAGQAATIDSRPDVTRPALPAPASGVTDLSRNLPAPAGHKGCSRAPWVSVHTYAAGLPGHPDIAPTHAHHHVAARHQEPVGVTW